MSMLGVAASADWEPGDSLYDPALREFGNYLFNFRDDLAGENCYCSDAASWPEPATARALFEDEDELTIFIAEWHAWRESEAS